jgi:mannan endo-1,4-beta-mannosidase
VLVWRNANRRREQREHHYAPYRRHPSAPDFLRFCADPLILLERDLPDLYRPGAVGTSPVHVRTPNPER